ncbi:MAG: hypothetical protein R2686_07020 [Candidatus Nanopelagicales bacterium]
MTGPLSPECRDARHTLCVGGPCICACHEQKASVLPAEKVAAMAVVMAFIVDRHTPDVFNAAQQGLTCQACSQLAGMPQAWPCPDRAAVGRLFPHPSNRLLPDDSQPYPRGAGPDVTDPLVVQPP